MKKKLTAVALIVCMIAIMLVGATMAYFTDKTEDVENTFTVGSVQIELNETFVQESQLMPGMDVNKDAWIENVGTNDAWVWAEVLIPAALDDKDDNSPAAPGLGNSLHFNYQGMYAKEYAQNTNAEGKFYNETLSKLWIMQYNDKGVKYGFVGTEDICGVAYNKFVMLYSEKLAPKAVTSNFMDKVYMDKAVDQCAETEHEDCLILADGQTHYTGNWEIIVRGFAMQAEGVASVEAAWAEYNGK